MQCIPGEECQEQGVPTPKGLLFVNTRTCCVGVVCQRLICTRLTTPSAACYTLLCRGSLQEVLQEFGPEGSRAVKGEIVLLVAGCTAEEQQYMTMSAAVAGVGVGPSFDSTDTSQQSREALVKQLVLKELALGKSVSATAKLLSQQLQIPRSKVYKLALELAGQQDLPEQP